MFEGTPAMTGGIGHKRARLGPLGSKGPPNRAHKLSSAPVMTLSNGWARTGDANAAKPSNVTAEAHQTRLLTLAHTRAVLLISMFASLIQRIKDSTGSESSWERSVVPS